MKNHNMSLGKSSQVLNNIDYKEVLSILLILVALTVVVLQLTDKVDIRNFTAGVYDNLLSSLPSASNQENLLEGESVNINFEALGAPEIEAGETISQSSEESSQLPLSTKEGPKTQKEQMKEKVKELRGEIVVLQNQLSQMQNKVNELQERIDQLKT